MVICRFDYLHHHLLGRAEKTELSENRQWFRSGSLIIASLRGLHEVVFGGNSQ
jgi:hypothetical protein